MLVQSSEHSDAVQQEMLIHSAVQHHPNILPLLDYCCTEPGGGGDGGGAGGGRTAPLPAATMTPPLPLGAPAAAGAGFVVPMPMVVGGGGGGGGRLPASASAGAAAGGLVSGGQGQSLSRMACFLFPVFRDGTLASELERLAAGGQMLPTQEVLLLFSQVTVIRRGAGGGI